MNATDVQFVLTALSGLNARVEELERRLAELGDGQAEEAQGKWTGYHGRLEAKHGAARRYLDERYGDDGSRLVGMIPQNVAGMFYAWCEDNGLEIEQGRGTAGILTREIMKRYGLVSAGNRYVKKGA